jgi:hypothetical protein
VKKKHIKFILFVIVLLIFIGILADFLTYQNFQLSIYNGTSQSIGNFYVTYYNTENGIKIKDIQSKAINKTEVILPEDYKTEGNLLLYYYDKNNVRHEEVIVDYFEVPARAKLLIIIKNINEDGVMDFKTIRYL